MYGCDQVEIRFYLFTFLPSYLFHVTRSLREDLGMEYARTVVSVIRARSVVVHKQTLVLAK